MNSEHAWVLAVDFGTTNTVASVGDARGIRPLNVNGEAVMPSAVFLTGDGGQTSPLNWMVGAAAVRFARRQLDRFEANPKRSIADQTLFLGGRSVPVVDAIAAVFRPIVEEAARQHGGQRPAAFVVTHPATWALSRVQTLCAAARAATADLRGWPEPRPVTEPEAAAQRTLELHTVPSEARLVVLDFGGGTVDVTVVDRHDDTVTPIGRPVGLDSLGGEDFDMRLARWMTAEVGAPDLYDRLAASSDPDARERAVEIRSHARAVKEQLSRQTVVPAQLPKSPPDLPDNTPVQVSKPQLEELIRGGRGREPGLTEAVALVDQALRGAPPGPGFAGVFLVGGSSRIPLLGALVTERTGMVPITHGDPTTAVSDGAARFGLTIADSAPAEPEPQPEPEHRGPAAAPRGRDTGARLLPDAPLPRRPARRGRSTARRVATLFLLALLVGGGGVAVAMTRAHPGTSGSVSTYTCADGTRVTYSLECPTVAPTTGPPTQHTTAPAARSPIRGCASLTQPGCRQTVLVASQAVWPEISGRTDCDVQGDDAFDQSFDEFTTSCATNGLGYMVVWRSAAAGSEPVVDIFASWMHRPAHARFKLDGDSQVLGVSVSGAYTNGNGTESYGCVREYADYPVAMIIVGPDTSATRSACATARFHHDNQMKAVLG